MEIGQFVFGHVSKEGQFELDSGWEHYFYTLFDFAGEGVGEHNDFVNNVFEVHPYWWGDCTCGWDDIDNGHQRIYELKHQPNCIRHKVEALDKKYYPSYDRKNRAKLLKELKTLYKEHGLNTEGDNWWHGFMTACTCDYPDRYNKIIEEYAKEFGHVGHKPDCKLELPNFWYKPENYKVWWYKYPMRSAYSNQLITEKHLQRIIKECIMSLEK